MMDTLNDDPNHDRLIEDYLFNGYQPASYKLSSDIDQQFARPIEDEDIFGINQNINPTNNELADSYPDVDRQFVGADSFCDYPHLDFAASNLQYAGKDLFTEDDRDAESALLSDFSPKKSRDIQDIRLGCISDDHHHKIVNQISDQGVEKLPVSSSACQAEKDKTSVKQTDSQSEKSKVLQRVREQLLAKGMRPRKPEANGGIVELDVNIKTSESPSKGRIIYEKMLQRSNESKKGPYGGRKVTWPIYSELLRKKISADKRKIWDSFQKPTDNYDDEEEAIVSEGEPDHSPSGSPSSSPSSQSDECPLEASEDGADSNFELEIDEEEAGIQAKESDEGSQPKTPINGLFNEEDDSDY